MIPANYKIIKIFFFFFLNVPLVGLQHSPSVSCWFNKFYLALLLQTYVDGSYMSNTYEVQKPSLLNFI